MTILPTKWLLCSFECRTELRPMKKTIGKRLFPDCLVSLGTMFDFAWFLKIPMRLSRFMVRCRRFEILVDYLVNLVTFFFAIFLLLVCVVDTDSNVQAWFSQPMPLAFYAISIGEETVTRKTSSWPRFLFVNSLYICAALFLASR